MLTVVSKNYHYEQYHIKTIASIHKNRNSYTDAIYAFYSGEFYFSFLRILLRFTSLAMIAWRSSIFTRSCCIESR